MQWRPCGTVADAIRRPLVVLFPWLWSGAAYVDKYVALLHSLGFDVLLVSWSFTAMWVPPWVRYMAWNVIEAVGKDLQQAGERPVVFYAFSGAAKVRGCCIIFLALFITSMSRPSAACHRLILCQQHRCHTMSSTAQQHPHLNKQQLWQGSAKQHLHLTVPAGFVLLVCTSSFNCTAASHPPCPASSMQHFSAPCLLPLHVSCKRLISVAFAAACRECSAASCPC